MTFFRNSIIALGYFWTHFPSIRALSELLNSFWTVSESALYSVTEQFRNASKTSSSLGAPLSPQRERRTKSRPLKKEEEQNDLCRDIRFAPITSVSLRSAIQQGGLREPRQATESQVGGLR
jgi:hypothetical protein